MTAPSHADLARRVEALRAELATQARRTSQSATLTLALGLLVLAALAGYFYYGYTQFSEVTRPDKIAGAVETMVDDNLPNVRKSIEEEVARSAPTWAAGLSKQARDSMPQARVKLEDYVVDRMKTTLDQGSELTHERFLEFVRNNRASLETTIDDLTKGPEPAEATVAELEKALEAQVQGDFRQQSRELMAAVNSMNERLKKLALGKNLTPSEQIDRRLAMIARRLQFQATPNGGAGPEITISTRRVAGAEAKAGTAVESSSLTSGAIRRRREDDGAAPEPAQSETHKQKARPVAASPEGTAEEKPGAETKAKDDGDKKPETGAEAKPDEKKPEPVKEEKKDEAPKD